MRKRMLINYIITILLSALITGALASYFIKDIYIREKQQKLQTNISLIEDNLEENYKYDEDINFYRLTQELASKTNTRVTFIDLEGHPIADSVNNSIIFKKQSFNQEFTNAINGELDIVRRYSIEVGDVFFYLYSTPMEVGEKQLVLRLGETNDGIDIIIDRFIKYLALSTLAGVCIAIFIAYISINKIISPIKELIKASKTIAQGDFSKDVTVNAKDEIQELAWNFNIMRSNLDSNIAKIREKNIEMNAILSSLKDGIIALDLNKNILVLNKSVNEILCINRQIELGENIRQILGGLNNKNEIIRNINNFYSYYGEDKICDGTKLISLTTYPIIDEEYSEIITGTLIIIKDITEIRKLENVRKDFVTNVSHELRTPLTSISGFVETLKTKELEEKNKIKALNIIGIETERLKTLINELLDLSKIENIKKISINKDININECILEVINLLSPQINSKNIRLDLKVEDSLISIKGDKELFRQMLINLIENSVKYNKDYGLVSIEVSNFNNGIKLIIEDDGVGIPKEDQEAIFNRFYRVDKSRSNNVEGSGLGLSIVKHIVLSFNGTIHVESKIEQGSKFIITIPN